MEPESIIKNAKTTESITIRTLRATLNLLTNVLIIFTVFVCLHYSWPSTKINMFQLHIIFCVLGYQFCMTQGTLILSKFNSWSMFIPRRYRVHLHWMLQLTGVVLVTYGSIAMMTEKQLHFESAHGVLGLCALMTSLLGFTNGILALHASRLESMIRVNWTKFIHFVTGIGTLFLSSACLCLGFESASFKSWSTSEKLNIALMVFTCLFTLFVGVDFWLSAGRRIRSLSQKI